MIRKHIWMCHLKHDLLMVVCDQNSLESNVLKWQEGAHFSKSSGYVIKVHRL